MSIFILFQFAQFIIPYQGLFLSLKGGQKNFLKNLKKTSYKSKKISQLVSEGKNLTNLDAVVSFYWTRRG